MSKKDYIKFAELLRNNKPYYSADALKTWSGITDDLTRIFKADNPRFNRDKFISYINKV